ncbi:MAG: hypothetical protein JWR81_5209 [Pseudonocardia sp.]|jgi:hypothetical protein|nr:hypothetical protein [Pseudonocardia sp.]MDT7618177.1 hypothetical protein [Pseudonocardiales bacterium]
MASSSHAPDDEQLAIGDPLGAIDRHRVRHGPYPLRLVGVGIAFAALTPAIWLPDLIAGVGSVGAVVAAVLGLVFLGLAANGVMLYQLARGYPPLDLPPASPARQRDESRRLWLLTAVPGGLVVQALRPRHRVIRDGARARPDVSGVGAQIPRDPRCLQESRWTLAPWTSPSGSTAAVPRSRLRRTRESRETRA